MSTFIPAPELLLSPRGRIIDGRSDYDLDADGISLPKSCDIAIIGSGLAGIALATHLWHAGRRVFVLIDPFLRPAAQFFQRVDALQQTVMRQAFCSRVAAMHEIPGKRVRAEVTALSYCPDGIMVTTTGGQTLAGRVIVAVGEAAVRAPAEWQLPASGPVSYWDCPGAPIEADRVAVIGSGLSSAHLIRLYLAQGKQVSSIQRSR